MYKNETMDTDIPTSSIAKEQAAATNSLADLCPFQRVMAANRGEIAVRINRAATELNLDTVSLYAYEGELYDMIQIIFDVSILSMIWTYHILTN